MNNDKIIQSFVDGQFEQVHCEKCENTFLTNVYDYGDTHVLLEKRSYGLEYYCGAIHAYDLQKVPDIKRIGVIDEMDNIVAKPSKEEIYSGNEPDFRFLYLMEKLKHLDEDDSEYFNRCVKDLDWQEQKDRKKIIAGVTKRYNARLAQDIADLYRYYKQHDDFMVWDLHGDNLMQRVNSGEIVILDPYTRKV